MRTQTLVDQGDRRPLDGERHLLVRLGGEVCTKSPRTRRRFLAVLTRNARAALRREGIAAEVTSEWTRLVVATPEPARGRETLARVFGVHRVHEVVQVPFSSLPDLVDSLVPLYRERVAGRSFAIRPKRRAPLQFSSHDLAVELGAALLPVAARVDLRHPDVEVIVELHDGHADAVLESSAAAARWTRRWRSPRSWRCAGHRAWSRASGWSTWRRWCWRSPGGPIPGSARSCCAAPCTGPAPPSRRSSAPARWSPASPSARCPPRRSATSAPASRRTPPSGRPTPNP